MSLGQFFHVGVIVSDLPAAQARLTELLGAAWGPILENEIEIRDGEGKELRVPNRICYSDGAALYRADPGGTRDAVGV